MALTLRGYGEVTGSGDLSLNYGTVLSGSAPVSGDLVIWCCRTYDAGDVNTLTTPLTWIEIKKRDATGHTFLSIAKIVKSADISSPATPSVNADDGQYLWLAFQAPGTLRTVDFNSADVAMTSAAPANVTIDESAEVGPGIMFSYHGGFGPDATALGEAWSGTTADSSFTSIVDAGGSEQEHVLRWKIYAAGAAGTNLTASQADRGSNNYQHVSAVWVTETAQLGILHSVETGIPRVKPALHSIAWGIASIDYDAASLAIFAAFSTPPGETRKRLIDDVVVALKAGGVWTLLDELQVHAAADSQAALVNWVNPGTYDGTLVNAPAFTIDRGFTGASTKYIDTNFNPTTATTPKYVQNSATAFGWSRTSGQLANAIVGLGAWLVVTPRVTGDLFNGRINILTTLTTVANTDGTGLYSLARTVSTTQQLYKNGALVTSGAATSTAPVNLNIHFLRYPNAPTYWLGECAAGGFGQYLNSIEQAALYNALNAYMVAVGAA